LAQSSTTSGIRAYGWAARIPRLREPLLFAQSRNATQ
jgi:hypothetical protein